MPGMIPLPPSPPAEHLTVHSGDEDSAYVRGSYQRRASWSRLDAQGPRAEAGVEPMKVAPTEPGGWEEERLGEDTGL